MRCCRQAKFVVYLLNETQATSVHWHICWSCLWNSKWIWNLDQNERTTGLKHILQKTGIAGTDITIHVQKRARTLPRSLHGAERPPSKHCWQLIQSFDCQCNYDIEPLLLDFCLRLLFWNFERTGRGSLFLSFSFFADWQPLIFRKLSSLKIILWEYFVLDAI